MNAETKRELSNGHVEVPTWVMVVTYILCWTFAVALIVSMLTGHIEYRVLILALAVYLMLWPVFQITPAEMLRKILPTP